MYILKKSNYKKQQQKLFDYVIYFNIYYFIIFKILKKFLTNVLINKKI